MTSASKLLRRLPQSPTFDSFVSAVAFLLVSCVLLQTAAKAEEATPPAVSPVVLLKDGAIRACGFQVAFTSQIGDHVFQFLIERDGDARTVSVVGNCRRNGATEGGRSTEAADAKQAAPVPFFSTRSYSTRGWFKNGRFSQPSDGIPAQKLTSSANDNSIAGFVHEMMIGGGKAGCFFHGTQGVLQEVAIPGPLPQLTRAAYLNCSGDLFRPGEER